jgi:predicted nucleotidyltransferase
VKKELNSKFWDENRQLLKPIKDKLLKVVDKAVEDLTGDAADEAIEVTNIYVTGSLASIGGWHSESDIDLHVVIAGADKTFIEEYARLYSKWFNDTYCFLIKGHEIELNVKTSEETGIEGKGIYDLKNDEWIAGPYVTAPKLDLERKAAVDKYYKMLSAKITALIDAKKPIETVDKIREIIRETRKKALAGPGGERSLGNLVFKKLRKNGDLERLSDYRFNLETELYSMD